MKKLLCILLSLTIVVSVCTISMFSSSAEVTYDYRDEFAKFALGDGYKYEEYVMSTRYEEHYKYYSEDNNTDIPDWIFGQGFSPFLTPGNCWAYLGDYYVFSDSICDPFRLGYFVYVPQENKFYDLEEAWEMDFEGMDWLFSQCIKDRVYVFFVLGDADNDKVLSVMDATQIQKELAQLAKRKCPHYYIADYTADERITIMDATAIQMKLAQV